MVGIAVAAGHSMSVVCGSCHYLVRCGLSAGPVHTDEPTMAVHHGKYFTPPDKIERLDAPQLETQPSTPPQVIQPASGTNGSIVNGNAIQPSLSSLMYRKLEESVPETVPFYCHGFV